MTTTETHFTPDREREFRLYIIWKSLDHTMSTKLFEQLGVTDELILEIADLKTQKDFGKKYSIDQKTMTNWNKQIKVGNIAPEYKELDWRYWAKQLTGRMASAVAREGIKTGNPQHFNSWMKYVEREDDKSTVKLEGWEGLADLIKGADKVLEEHGETI